MLLCFLVGLNSSSEVTVAVALTETDFLCFSACRTWAGWSLWIAIADAGRS